MKHKAYAAKYDKKQSAIKLIVLAVCVLFAAGSLFSAAFIFTHINHEHNQHGPAESCATCAQILGAGNLLKLLSIAMAGPAFVFGRFSDICPVLKSIDLHTNFCTLFRLKVRLNN
jgi:hypothetical protein